MFTKRIALALLGCMLTLAGCRDDGGAGPGDGTGRAYITSDPPGARISVDGRRVGRLTPDTIGGLPVGRREIIVTLDSLGYDYRYRSQVVVAEDSVSSVSGPVVLRCEDPLCYQRLRRYHNGADLRIAANAIGSVLLDDATGNALYWPVGSRHSYVSHGTPMFAARMGGDTVGLGIYDIPFFAGRPVAPPALPPGRTLLSGNAWIIPPPQFIALATIRGLQIEHRLVASNEIPNTAAIRLIFRNISTDPLYQLTDPLIPEQGVVFENAFIGFAMDTDIGRPEDDLYSYAPELNMVFAYDAQMEEGREFVGDARTAPGLIGLRVLEAPAGAGVILNGWANVGSVSPDWGAGKVNEAMGLRMMSGIRPYPLDHPDPRIGTQPEFLGDIRIMVSAGPLTLAPGQADSITVAIALATPVAGLYTSGEVLQPGSPFDITRQLALVAAELFSTAIAAEELLTFF